MMTEGEALDMLIEVAHDVPNASSPIWVRRLNIAKSGEMMNAVEVGFLDTGSVDGFLQLGELAVNIENDCYRLVFLETQVRDAVPTNFNVCDISKQAEMVVSVGNGSVMVGVLNIRPQMMFHELEQFVKNNGLRTDNGAMESHFSFADAVVYKHLGRDITCHHISCLTGLSDTVNDLMNALMETQQKSVTQICKSTAVGAYNARIVTISLLSNGGACYNNAKEIDKDASKNESEAASGSVVTVCSLGADRYYMFNEQKTLIKMTEGRFMAWPAMSRIQYSTATAFTSLPKIDIIVRTIVNRNSLRTITVNKRGRGGEIVPGSLGKLQLLKAVNGTRGCMELEMTEEERQEAAKRARTAETEQAAMQAATQQAAQLQAEEADRVEKEKKAQMALAAEAAAQAALLRSEQERIAREQAALTLQAEQARIAQEQATAAQAEQERIAREQAALAIQAEQARIAQEQAAAAQAAQEQAALATQAEQARIAQAQAAESIRAEQERVAQEVIRAEQERAAQEQAAEQGRLAREQAARVRMQQEQERIQRESDERAAAAQRGIQQAAEQQRQEEQERLREESAERQRALALAQAAEVAKAASQAAAKTIQTRLLGQSPIQNGGQSGQVTMPSPPRPGEQATPEQLEQLRRALAQQQQSPGQQQATAMASGGTPSNTTASLQPMSTPNGPNRPTDPRRPTPPSNRQQQLGQPIQPGMARVGESISPSQAHAELHNNDNGNSVMDALRAASLGMSASTPVDVSDDIESPTRAFIPTSMPKVTPIPKTQGLNHGAIFTQSNPPGARGNRQPRASSSAAADTNGRASATNNR